MVRVQVMSNYYDNLYKALEGYTVVKFLGFYHPNENDPFCSFPRLLMQKDDDQVVCYVSKDEEMNDRGVLIFEKYEGKNDKN